MRRLTKKFLGLESVYHKPTRDGPSFIGWSMLIIFTLMMAGLTIYGLANPSEDEILSPILLLAIISPILIASLATAIRGLIRGFILHRLARQRHYLGDLPRIGPQASYIDASVIFQEVLSVDGHRGVKSLTAKVIDQQAGWWLYDVSFMVYHDGNSVAERCYTVFEIGLRQTTPHLVFDSKRAKGQQFRTIYLKSQQVPFSGDLDQKFVAYYPKHHEIDTLSFITPEVIDSLLTLDRYDFEFLHGRLFCYAPFLFPDELDSFRSQCLGLHAKVNDNLRWHQPADQAVKSFGRQLMKRSVGKTILGLGLLTLALPLTVLLLATSIREIKAGDGLADPGFFVLLLACLGLWLAIIQIFISLAKQKRQQDQLEQQFLDLA